MVFLSTSPTFKRPRSSLRNDNCSSDPCRAKKYIYYGHHTVFLRPPTMAFYPYLPSLTTATVLQALVGAAAADPPPIQLDQYLMRLELELAYRRSLFIHICSIQGWFPTPPPQQADAGPLAQFFTGYDGFTYIPFEPAGVQFRRLVSERGWKDGSKSEKKARTKFRTALVKQFNFSYGTDETSLDNWRRLCAYLGFFPLPNTIEDCRKVNLTYLVCRHSTICSDFIAQVVLHTHVNLEDLLDGIIQGVFVTVFRTVHELIFYTKTTGKIFPRENIHAGNLLKHLLRHIIHPELDDCDVRRP